MSILQKTDIVPINRFSASTQVIMLCLLIFGSLTAAGSLLGWLLVFIFSGDYSLYMKLLTEGMQFQSTHINAMYAVQAGMAIAGFILLPLLWNHWVWKRPIKTLFQKPSTLKLPNSLYLLIAIFALIIILLPVTWWNENLTFPHFMLEWEQTFRRWEDLAKEQTKLFTSFSSPTQFGLAFFVLALIPALGEELLFRGIIQPLSIQIAKNPHIGIFVTAFLFSAFHFQFFGFLPRFFFGVFFGYLVHITGSLWPAFFCHFINNSLTLILLYLYRLQITTIDFTTYEDIPMVYILFIFPFFLFFTYVYCSKLKDEELV